ncbi:hypothetical protein GCM10009608_33360 [Pseudonocardia alaniniphila]
MAGGLVGGELAGPAAGGWLFGVAAALPLITNSAGLVVAVVLVYTLPDVFASLPSERRPSGSAVIRTIRDEIRAGLVWLWNDRQLRHLIAATCLVITADGAFLAVLGLYVTEILGEQPATYGILLGVGAIGGILGGLTCGRMVRRFGSAGVLWAAVVAMASAQLLIGTTANTFTAVHWPSAAPLLPSSM